MKHNFFACLVEHHILISRVTKFETPTCHGSSMSAWVYHGFPAGRNAFERALGEKQKSGRGESEMGLRD
jgi:hypothetical protein